MLVLMTVRLNRLKALYLAVPYSGLIYNHLIVLSDNKLRSKC